MPRSALFSPLQTAQKGVRSRFSSQKLGGGAQGARRATIAHLKAQHKSCRLLLTNFWCPAGLPWRPAPLSTLFGRKLRKSSEGGPDGELGAGKGKLPLDTMKRRV